MEDEEQICPACQRFNDLDNMNEAGQHELRAILHDQIHKSEEKKELGLTFLVVGGILVILAIIFFVLSFRFNTKKVKIFTPGTTEFIICCITGALGIASLIFGFLKFLFGKIDSDYFRDIMNQSEQVR